MEFITFKFLFVIPSLPFISFFSLVDSRAL